MTGILFKYNWCAMDQSGVWWKYHNKPEILENNPDQKTGKWVDKLVGPVAITGVVSQSSRGWRTSLEKIYE